MRVLTQLAQEYGLELIDKCGFHELFLRERDAYEGLLSRMRVLNSEGTISPDEWEAIGVYCMFAFRKIT